MNYTNPGAFKGYIREFYPVGPQTITIKILPKRKVSRVELLRGGKDVPFHHVNGSIRFQVPSVLDYEIAAIYAS